MIALQKLLIAWISRPSKNRSCEVTLWRGYRCGGDAQNLEKSRAGEGADANDEASLVADKRTNSVIVTADEVSIERIKGLIDYLDIPLEQSGNVRVMYLEYADATEVAEVLTRVMQNLARLDDESSGRTRAANAAKSTIEADEGTTASS